MNNNLRMSGAMFLMLKKSSDRRQREALEAAFRVKKKNQSNKVIILIYFWLNSFRELMPMGMVTYQPMNITQS